MEKTDGLCHAIREEGLLIKLLDGELSSAEEARVLAHLRSCVGCLGVVADLLYTDSRLKELFSRPNAKREHVKKTSQHFMIEVDKLPVGKSLGRDLLDEEGRLLVAAGTVLTSSLIESIKARGIEKVAVKAAEEIPKEEEKEPEVEPISVLEVESFVNEQDLEPVVSKFVRERCRAALVECFEALEKEGTFVGQEAISASVEIAGEVLSRPSLAPTLADIILVDPSLHAHSVNVLVIFLMLARAMGYPGQLIKEHAPMALLHDIGRIVVKRTDATLGMKRASADEEREHPEIGSSYLWNFGGINQSALNMVRNHHERYDGGGYPRGLKGTSLSDWDQLLIFANTFDNLVWNRETGVRSGFYKALATLIQDGAKYVRRGIVGVAVQTFGNYPPGSWVRLNTGEIGVVTRAYAGSPLKPLVGIFYGKDGKRLSRPKVADLSSNSNFYIHSPIDVEMVV